MKKFTAAVLALVLVLALTLPVLAEGKAPLNVEREVIRGNSSWTKESYPEVWLTPYFAEYVIEGKEDYPPVFLNFPPPEGASPLSFDPDDAAFLDHDTLMGYYYSVTDRYSFEVFLEDVPEERIIKDGSDGVAMFVVEDSRRAKGLIDIKKDFGKTAKMMVELYDHSGSLSDEKKSEALQAEMERLLATMKAVTLEEYWSKDAFGTVQLYVDRQDIVAEVDASGLIVTKIDENEIVFMGKNAAGKVEESEIRLDSYSYANSKEEGGEPTTRETMADGREFLVFNTDYTGYAASVVIEKDRYDRPLFIAIDGDSAPAEFPAKLVLLYDRVTLHPEGISE